MAGLDLYGCPDLSVRASRGPDGEAEVRSIPGGGGKIIGEADERSGAGRGPWLVRVLGDGPAWGWEEFLLCTSAVGDGSGYP